jgi:tellurite resistance protein TerC
MFATLIASSSSSEAPGANLHIPAGLWAGFLILIAGLLLLDLFVFHKDAHVVTPKEALKFSAFWIGIGVAFTFVVWAVLGGGPAGQYITGYLIEKSLSIDNVFVWAVIFSYFAVPPKYQHRTLFWGIFGALVLRAIFIFAGVALLNAIEWIVYVFGAFLLYTSYKIWTHDEMEVHPEKNPVLNLVRRIFPSTSDFREDHFFVKEPNSAGRVVRMMTPLFAVLIMVEVTDVVFAIDSIPAILAVSQSQFIVFSSNAFAILGLRSLYFLLAGMSDKFRYLNNGLSIILGYVGVKFLLAGFGRGTVEPFIEDGHIATWISLVVIAVVLTATILLSLRADKRDPHTSAEALDDPSDGPPAGSTEHPAPSTADEPDTSDDPV